MSHQSSWQVLMRLGCRPCRGRWGFIALFAVVMLSSVAGCALFESSDSTPMTIVLPVEDAVTDDDLVGLAEFSVINPAETALSEQDQGPDPSQASSKHLFIGSSQVEVSERPPRLIVRNAEGELLLETAKGIVSMAKTVQTSHWLAGVLGVQEDVQDELGFADGHVEINLTGKGVDLTFLDAGDVPRLVLSLEGVADHSHVRMTLTPTEQSADYDQVRLHLACHEDEVFMGLGGQTHGTDHRGMSIPVQVSGRGVGLDPDLDEDEVGGAGHLWDSSYPLPSLVVHRPESGVAYGLVAETERRSRFELCTDEGTQVQVSLQGTRDPSSGELLPGQALFALIVGATPREVVEKSTSVHGRAQPVPDWVFGPWLSTTAGPAMGVAKAQVAITEEIPIAAVVLENFMDYAHHELAQRVGMLHALGLRCLTAHTVLLGADRFDGFEEALENSWAARDMGGDPYLFDLGHEEGLGLLDLALPDAWNWLRGKLSFAWGRGVDGWFVDGGELVAPDMQFWGEVDGLYQSNLYPMMWSELNDIARRSHHKTPDRAIIVSQAGYLGSIDYEQVVWPPPLKTDFGSDDGMGAVIPFALNLGLSGVSAIGSNIGGHLGIVSPVRDRELHYRWTQLAAMMPVMASHDGLLAAQNWNWDTDEDSIAHFRTWATRHMQLVPYLVALHAEATATGVPAMRHLALEFPTWSGVRGVADSYMLGPALLVAPVMTRGDRSRLVSLPPGTWYRLWDGARYLGGQSVDITLPLEETAVFLRAGEILPQVDDRVRASELSTAIDLMTVDKAMTERLELHIGVGEPASRELADDTIMTFGPLASDGQIPAELVDGESLSPIPACTAEQHVLLDPCYQLTMGSRVLRVTMAAGAELVLGTRWTGTVDAYRLSVSDDVPNRLYDVWFYHGQGVANASTR